MIIGRFGKRFDSTRNDITVIKMFLTGFRQIVESIRSESFHRPGSRQELLPVLIVSKWQVCWSMMRDMLHRLEPIVGIAELCDNQRIMRVSIVAGVLEPMLVPSEFGADFNRVIEALGQVTVGARRREFQK